MSGSVSRCLRDRGRAERPTTMRPRGRDRPQVGTGRRGRPRTVPREGQTGATDIWSLAVAEGAVAEILIPDAWSPAVVRP